MSTTLRAVVTGASSGIGAATVRDLRARGWEVYAAARRQDRLEALAAETGAIPVRVDVTSADDLAELVRVATADGPVHALVANAGGAAGVDPIETADAEQWQWMYDVNVLGVLRTVQALLPALEASGRGDIVVLSSTAGFVTYEGGAGYSAAKHAAHAIAGTLRLELSGRPVRVIEIAPGMVHTEEFSLNRLGGDAEAAAKVYEGVAKPLMADDVADAIGWTLSRPHHVNIDLLVMRPIAQAAQHKVARHQGL